MRVNVLVTLEDLQPQLIIVYTGLNSYFLILISRAVTDD